MPRKQKRKLNARQVKFIEAYIETGNATKSAIKAGYSEKSAAQQGSKLANTKQILAEISRRQAKVSQKTDITAEYVLGAIKEAVDRGLMAVPVLDRQGNQVYIENENGETVAAYTFDSGAVLKGSELLGKYLGLFTEKVDLQTTVVHTVLDFGQSSPIDITPETTKERAALPSRGQKPGILPTLD